MKLRHLPAIAALSLAAALTTWADTVLTKDKKKLEGRVLRESEAEVVILTYKDGEVSIPKSEVVKVTKGKNKFDDYDAELKKVEPKKVEDHLKLAAWCKKTGLLTVARKHWEEVLKLDPGHEEAHKALGHVKEGDRWLTEEEYYPTKGYVKVDGKWISPEENRKRQEAKLAGQIKEAIKITLTFKPNASKEQMDKWVGQVQFWSQVIWDMTGGAVYLSDVAISDQSESGDVVVVNLDSLHIDDRGTSGRAETGRKKFIVGGLCNAFVFVHEFFHAWAGLPDHYGTKIECLMNSSERSLIFKWKFCDPCWKQVQATWKLPFRPEFVENEELPGPTSPGKHGRPKDYGDAPETRVTVTDR